MISINNISLYFGGQTLFKDMNDEREITHIEQKVMILGFLAMATGLTITPMVDHMNWLFLTSLFVAGGNSLLAPTATAIISQKGNESEQGVILGVTQGLGSLGRIFGPPYGGLTYHGIHMMFPFVSSAIILIGAVIYYLISKLKS